MSDTPDSPSRVTPKAWRRHFAARRRPGHAAARCCARVRVLSRHGRRRRCAPRGIVHCAATMRETLLPPNAAVRAEPTCAARLASQAPRRRRWRWTTSCRRTRAACPAGAPPPPANTCRMRACGLMAPRRLLQRCTLWRTPVVAVRLAPLAHWCRSFAARCAPAATRPRQQAGGDVPPSCSHRARQACRRRWTSPLGRTRPPAPPRGCARCAAPPRCGALPRRGQQRN
jgi:hypothetical protein